MAAHTDTALWKTQSKQHSDEMSQKEQAVTWGVEWQLPLHLLMMILLITVSGIIETKTVSY